MTKPDVVLRRLEVMKQRRVGIDSSMAAAVTAARAGGCPHVLVKASGEDFWSGGSGGFGEVGLWCGGLVGLLGAEHGEDDVAAPAGEADERGVVTFAFGSFAVVEGLGVRASAARRRRRGTWRS